jgi:DNA-binding transcriptional ArsR family regulator
VNVLLGTQMIAKGLDYPNVTLVGIISADTALHLQDFRASERTFQLISQVAGRAGRGATRGEVVIQTCMPDNETIKLAAQQDFVGFYEQEIVEHADVSRSAVNLATRSLPQTGLILLERRGRMNFYAADERHPFVRQFKSWTQSPNWSLCCRHCDHWPVRSLSLGVAPQARTQRAVTWNCSSWRRTAVR